MLELRQVVKTYPAGGDKVEALKGIDLQFRSSEFVAVLGPSGCGKTTMLNIIGGLDQYTSGDLIINGKSTKDFKDRDWDAYRNHSIGFVFQSYNLIPHQTVLQNVELALTLSGVSKSERRKRAKKALDEVGLSSQINKRPNEMSGGQMQRVAIARAIVNNPDIILADEPTGALDTETSVQVMDILKEISKNRLIIMVTHNPDLAKRYATRTVCMLDGIITDDSAPFTPQDAIKERSIADKKVQIEGKVKKPSMSFATSFGLSLKNLFTKKGRTALTSFAGSIGIIGIALIFAVSNGMTGYIDTVQEETLASYPLTLESQNVDLSSMMQAFINTAQSKDEHENDAVYQKSMLSDLVNALSNIEEQTNDLASFKAFIETAMDDVENESGLNSAISAVQYTYDLDLLIYTESVDGTIIKSDTVELMQQLLAQYMNSGSVGNDGANSGGMPLTSLMTAQTSRFGLWQEMIPGDNGSLISSTLENQYDLVYGSWPTEYNEVVLVLDNNNELDDMTLYALGLLPRADVEAIMDAAMNGETVQNESHNWSYEDICAMEFRTLLPSSCYTLDESSGLYTDIRESDAGLRYLYANGMVLKVSGIIRPSEDALAAMLSGSIGYTSELTKYIIEAALDSDAVIAQMSNPAIDIFTGLPFEETSGSMSEMEKRVAFIDYISELDLSEKAKTYIDIMCIPSTEYLKTALDQAMAGVTREDMENTLLLSLTEQMGMSTDSIESYISAMSDDDITAIFREGISEQIKMQYAAAVREQFSAMSESQLAAALDSAISGYSDEECAMYYDEILTFSDSTYEENLITLGCLNLDEPSSINIFASTFEDKDMIESAIAAYNETVDELHKISYTDYVGLMMSSVTTIINAITYVLIAFVGISLIVSSIMIGVITLISVQERTKEIGILRAIGASKRNVSSMFNAETIIIGFTSGTLGVLLTYLLCIPINLILHSLTGINNLSAFLPLPVAIVLVLISMTLTVISGVIPSRSAAKKDPVVALRTE